MSPHPTPPTAIPVRTSVTVDVPREHAWTVFTERFDAWWPRDHHVLGADLAAAVIEPREGGRWYERGVDGRECDWGYVITWDPPSRLVLAWQLDATFRPDPGLVTEVEVRFTAEGPHRTHVELEHRHLERFGEGWSRTRDSLGGENGWPGILRTYAGHVPATA